MVKKTISRNARVFVFACIILVFSINLNAQGAILSVGDVVKFDRVATAGGSLGGGEFAIYKLENDAWQRLDVSTFCLEFNEHLWLDGRFKVGSLSDRAIWGGLNTSSGGDPLEDATRFLYSRYVTSGLSLSGYLPNDSQWADALQQAIWKFEGEIGAFTGPSAAKALQLYDYAINNVVSGGISDNVYAINLFYDSTPSSLLSSFDPYKPSTWGDLANYRAQDQLFYVPTLRIQATGVVPEPASWVIAITLAGTMGLIFGKRKKSTRIVTPK